MSADVSPSEPPTLGPGRGLPVVSGSSASRCRIIGVAIPIPDPHGPLLQSKRAEFNDPLAHAIPAHVTLLGPTEVTDEGLPGLVSHLADVASVSEPGGAPAASDSNRGSAAAATAASSRSPTTRT
jgi:hypothetical protein